MTAKAEINTVIEEWSNSFRDGDAERLKAIWAQDRENLTYLPTEYQEPMRTWAEIAGYYDHLCAFVIRQTSEISDIVIDVLTDEVAFARLSWSVTFDAAPADYPPGKHHWTGRSAFCFLKTEGAWKVVHYEDSTFLFELFPLIRRFQAGKLDKVAELIESDDRSGAIEAVESLRTEIKYTDLSTIEPE